MRFCHQTFKFDYNNYLYSYCKLVLIIIFSKFIWLGIFFMFFSHKSRRCNHLLYYQFQKYYYFKAPEIGPIKFKGYLQDGFLCTPGVIRNYFCIYAYKSQNCNNLCKQRFLSIYKVQYVPDVPPSKQRLECRNCTSITINFAT